MKRALTLALTATLLSGCGTVVMNGPNQATSVAERHPITVDQQTVSLRVAVDSTLDGLSRGQIEDIDRFVTAYRTRGHGPITVTAPDGTRRDLEAQETAANIRSALNRFGIDYADIKGATYRAGGQPSAVIVSFVRYVASGPVCGNYSGELNNRMRNLSAPNFGCADQHNLAAMVADPRDLTRMQEAAPSDGETAARAVRTANGDEGP